MELRREEKDQNFGVESDIFNQVAVQTFNRGMSDCFASGQSRKLYQFSWGSQYFFENCNFYKKKKKNSTENKNDGNFDEFCLKMEK